MPISMMTGPRSVREAVCCATLRTAIVFSILLGTLSTSAQVTNLDVWTLVYSGNATTTQTLNYPVPTSPTNSGKRLMVVAVASARGGTTAGARTVTLTYGGQPFSLFTGDMAQTGIIQHTAIYFLDEARIAAAADNQLSLQVSNGTTALTTAWLAVYDNVDQDAPLVLPRNGFTSGTTTSSGLAFDPPLALDPGDIAIKVICSNSTVLRNVTSIGAGWEDPQTQTGGTNPTRNAVSQRDAPLVATNDAAGVTLNGASRLSMSGAVVNGLLTTTTTLEGPVVPRSGFGEPVTFTATVAPGTATGMVEFFDGNELVGTEPLMAGGTATFTTTELRGGTHSLRALYAGDALHRSSLSNTVDHWVDAVEVSDANFGNGFHPDLPTAIGAIGTAGQAGADITVTIHDDLRDAAAIATIPQGDWESLLIKPSGDICLSASVNGALLTLDGADRVTIDGIGYSGDDRLVINNPNTGLNANAIRFTNDAVKNTVRNCTLRGATLTTGSTQQGAVVAFLTGVTTGNDDNAIVGCRIRNANLDPRVFTPNDLLPRRAIFSAGSGGATVLARHNSGNLIADNWIFNYFSSNAVLSRGLMLGGGNHAWVVRGNRFFQEAPRAFTVTDATHRMIDVEGLATNTHPNAGGHVIRENVLGFASGDGTGTHTISGAGSNSDNVFRAISFDVPNTGPRSIISANIIDGIKHSSSVNATSATGSPITLIFINSGQVDVDSNRIGRLDAVIATVEFINSSAASLQAIFNNAGTDLRTRGNRIGGIVYPNASFYALRSNGSGTWQCAHNELGGALYGIRGTNGQAGRTLAGISAGNGVLVADSNVVRNLELTMTVNTNSGPRVIGIELTGGGPHTLTGNTIHDIRSIKTGTGGSTSDATVSGIYSTRAVTAVNNSIRRLAFYGTGTAADTPNDLPMNATIRGIWTNGATANLTATGNIIDSLHVNLPDVPDVGKRRYEVQGIRTEGSAVSVVATSNWISRLRVNEGHSVNQPSSQWTADSANTRNGALMGINIAQGLNTTLEGNWIFDLENNGSANLQVFATGIRVASTGTNVISRNLVHTIRPTRGTGSNAVTSHATGIWLVAGGSSTVVNNMVRLGVDRDGTLENTGYRVRGIWSAVNAGTPNRLVRLWHNSVYVAGAVSASSAQDSHALLAQNNTIRDIRNNIFWNARESHSVPGTGQHYAMEAGSASANLTSDFNCLRITGSNGTRHIARAGTTNYTTLGAWQATGRDGNSFTDDPSFMNPNGDVGSVDLHIALPSPIDATGVLIAEVEIDIDADWRPALTPVDIGADAVNPEVLPVVMLDLQAEVVMAGRRPQVQVEWSTASETNSDRFVVERSANGRDFLPIGSVPAAGWSLSRQEYGLLDEAPLSGPNYYRLRQVDLDGTFTHSHAVVALVRRGTGPMLWPNPAGACIQLGMENPGPQPLTIVVYDAAGREVLHQRAVLDEGATEVQVPLQGIDAGPYLLRVFDADGQDLGIARFIKQ